MNNEQEIERMAKSVPQTIVAYDRAPKGLHLYGEQREEIAEALLNAGYGNVKQAVKEAFEKLKAEIVYAEDIPIYPHYSDGYNCACEAFKERIHTVFKELYGAEE